jgi:DNA-binding CsgD family transcriptional regulator
MKDACHGAELERPVCLVGPGPEQPLAPVLQNRRPWLAQLEEIHRDMHNRADPTPALLLATAAVLDRHPDPLFIVDTQRRLHFRNLTAKRVLESRSGLSQQRGRLSAGSIPDDRRLEALLATVQASTGMLRPQPRGLRLHQSGPGRRWYVLVHPLTSGLPGGSNSLFLLHTVARMHSPGALGALGALLRDLFGLTRAETAAALTVVKTGQIDVAAHELSLSRETIRSHLKAVFRKCDIHSTLELAGLVRATAVFSGPDRRRERLR